MTDGRAEKTAALALLLATVFWGCGFTWAKAAGEAVHREAGLPHGSAFGPIFLLAWRWLLAGLVLLALVPAARRGWKARSFLRVGGVGVLLAIGLIVQHLGLDRTSEAVSAFLTSLAVLFVPLLLTVVLFRPPPPLIWAGVAVATAGVWLMTGATPAGFGAGEWLGLSCALAFSLYIFAVNAAGQCLAVGLVCAATCLLLDGGPRFMQPANAFRLLAPRDVWLNLLLLTVFPTLGGYVLLNFFQPRLDPTRATLIYLVEPVAAAAYAWVAVGRGLDATGLIGAGLILLANVLVEVFTARAKRRRAQ